MLHLLKSVGLRQTTWLARWKPAREMSLFGTRTADYPRLLTEGHSAPVRFGDDPLRMMLQKPRPDRSSEGERRHVIAR